MGKAHSTQQTETLAVSAFAMAFARCERIEEFIEKNDKTPLTDGHIDLYERGKAHSRDWFVGRVPVQVKGRKWHNQKNRKISITRAELKGFLKTGGLLYLVGYVPDNPHDIELFYCILSPFRLSAVIAKLERDSLSSSFILEPFPKEVQEVESLIEFCYETQRQIPNQPTRLMIEPAAFRIKSPRPLNLSRPQRFLLEDGSAHFELIARDGGVISIESDIEVIPADYMNRYVDKPVSCGPARFEGYRTRRVDETHMEVAVTGTCKFVIGISNSQSGGQIEFDVSWSSRLAERIREVQFVKSVLQGTPLLVGDVEISVARSPELDGELASHLEWLTAVSNDLTTLSVDANLVEIVDLVEEDLKIISHLAAVFRGEVAMPKSTQQPGRMRVKLGRQFLEIILYGNPDNENIEVINPFESHGRFIYVSEPDALRDVNGGQVVTPYDLLTAEELAATANFNLKSASAAYVRLRGAPHFGALIGSGVINFWHAARLDTSRKTAFLEAALALTEVALEGCLDESSGLVCEANLLLLHCELGRLGQGGIDCARNLKRRAIKLDTEMTPFIEMACSFILNDDEELCSIYDTLTGGQILQMQDWPMMDTIEPIVSSDLRRLS